MKAETPLQVNLARLRQSIEQCFSIDEMRTLCSDLDVEPENVPGQTRKEMSRELVGYFERQGRLLELVHACQQVRPLVPWSSAAKESIPAPDSTSRRRVWPAYIVGGIAVLLAGIGGFLLAKGTPPPHVSLVSLSYMVDDFDRRVVDLRRASTIGIPARAEHSLQISDLWISVPQDTPECTVHAEIYANDDPRNAIGSTPPVPLNAGTLSLGHVTVLRFNDGQVPEAWNVQPDWTDLQVVLVTQRDGKAIGATRTTIHLDAGGTAWLIDPPDANFTAIVYTVNENQPLVLDLREADKVGLNVKPGDVLTLREIWYHANADSDSGQVGHVEAYLTAEGNGYDEETHKVAPAQAIQKGIHKLESDPSNPLSWTVPQDREVLILTLARNDKAVMDRLVLPLSAQGSPGLALSSEPVPWHFDHSTYVDFEHEGSDFTGWRRDFRRSSDYAFTGQQSLQFSFSVTETSPSRVFIWRGQKFKAEGLVAHYYLPSEPDVEIEWLQFCVIREAGTDWQCRYSHVTHTRDRWNAVMSDFSKLPKKGDLSWNESELSGFAMQGKITARGATEPISYSIYLDAIEIFELEDDNP